MTELSTKGQKYATDDNAISMERSDIFDEAYTTFYPRVVTYLRKHGAYEDAEDIAQETFVRAFRHLDTYEDRGKLGSWLCTIAMHALIDHVRRRSKRPLDFTDDAEMLDRIAPDYGAEPGATVTLDHSRDDAMNKIIANVTADQANIFRLMIDGYNSSEISEILSVPRATVLTRIHRGRKALKAAGILPLE